MNTDSARNKAVNERHLFALKLVDLGTYKPRNFTFYTSKKIETLSGHPNSPPRTHTMEITESYKKWRNQRTQIWNKVDRALSSLSAEGMIAAVDCFSYNEERERLDPEGQDKRKGQDIRIVCALYFRDTDDEGNPAGLYYLDKEQEAMRDSSGNCTFCGSRADKPQEDLDKTKGRFRCPIKGCAHWAPKQFKEKLYGGIFRIVYGGEAIFEGPSPDKYDGQEGMRNEEQIEAIKRVITEEFKDFQFT